MEQKTAYLDLTIVSARDVNRRSWLPGDEKRAVAWVDPAAKKMTKVVKGGSSYVEWDEKLTLALDGVDHLAEDKLLHIGIYSREAWFENLLGTVYVPLVHLPLDGQKDANTLLTYQVVQPTGKRHGSLSFIAKIVKPRPSSQTSKSPMNSLDPSVNTLYQSSHMQPNSSDTVLYPSLASPPQGPPCPLPPYEPYPSSPLYPPYEPYPSTPLYPQGPPCPLPPYAYPSPVSQFTEPYPSTPLYPPLASEAPYISISYPVPCSIYPAPTAPTYAAAYPPQQASCQCYYPYHCCTPSWGNL